MQIERAKYEPKLPKALQGAVKVKEGEPTQSVDNQEEIKKLFPNTYGMPLVEFVPGENLSNKNYKWDKKDGYYVSPKHIMYSSYFFNPEDESLSVLDKMKLHGNDFVKWCDGGQASHINLDHHLSKEQYRKLLMVAAEEGCSYFTYNVRQSVCNDCGFISKDTLDTCPKCGSKHIDYLTRIIGYLKRVSSFNEARQIEEGMRSYTNS